MIPPSVKVIQEWAFYYCTQLKSVYLGEGLEENGEAAYFDCKSLTEIKIPPSTITMEVKILGEGLKEIGGGGV